MAQNWFRLYREIIHDPKLRRTPVAQRWLWVTILCLADDDGVVRLAEGTPYSIEDLADLARVAVKDVEAGLKRFDQDHLRMIERLPDAIIILRWSKRQFKSDSSTERVKALRDRRRNVSETLHGSSGNETATAPETDTETEDRIENRTENRTEKITSATPPADAGGSAVPELELTPPEGDEPRGSRGIRKRDRVSNPDVPKLIGHYVSEFERTQGARPLLQEPDAVAAAAVLRNRTYPDAAVLVTTFLEQPDQFTKAHGLLRLRDLPAAVTKILARGSSASSGPRRDRTGAVIPDDSVVIEDLVAVDERGIERLVRVRKDGRTGAELGRTWGRPVVPEEGGDGEGQPAAPGQAR